MAAELLTFPTSLAAGRLCACAGRARVQRVRVCMRAACRVCTCAAAALTLAQPQDVTLPVPVEHDEALEALHETNAHIHTRTPQHTRMSAGYGHTRTWHAAMAQAHTPYDTAAGQPAVVPPSMRQAHTRKGVGTLSQEHKPLRVALSSHSP